MAQPKKNNFFEALKKSPPKNIATKLEGGVGGGSNLSGRATKKRTFLCGLPKGFGSRSNFKEKEKKL